MSALENLRNAKTLGDLATLLGYKPSSLSYIVYKMPGDRYTDFTIPKKQGGERNISAPVDQLKKVQRRLADLLNRCHEEICIDKSYKKSLSHGFRKHHSIITNATNHKNKRYVFNVDLKDFFPSINYGRVWGFFIKSADFSLEPKVASTIAKIACHNNELPQGSPCSPVISNLIGHLLDIRMVNLAKKSKCTYSRYADDLTFSTNQKSFPEDIAFLEDEESSEWVVGGKLGKKIESVGFFINENKVSMQYKTSRQLTTGLVVNEKVNIKREYYKHARAMCHSLFTTGTFYTDNEVDPDERDVGKINKLEGILNHIYQVRRPHDKRKMETRRNDPCPVSKIYREFLFFKHFFALKKPLIICEGKTDVVYLKCALKRLIENYESLIKKNDGKFEFLINFLNRSKNFRDVTGTAEGSSGQRSLMTMYKTHMYKFKGNGTSHPVILLIDNDSGADEIYKELKKAGTYDGDKTKDFYHYRDNLYIIPTPLKDHEKESLIENFFESAVREKEVSGKTFNPDKNFDKHTEYSKIVFAEKVIKQEQADINFDNFKPIMDRIIKVIAEHNNKAT